MTSNEEQKISNKVSGMYHKSGVYYTGFCKQYHSLTSKELEVQDDLVKELVADYEHVSKKYLYLELKKIKYPFMGRDEVYYVRNFGQYIGKVAISVQSLGNDHFDLAVIYYYKKITPYHNMKLKRIAPYGEGDTVTQSRYAARKAHRIARSNQTTRGTKSL